MFSVWSVQNRRMLQLLPLPGDPIRNEQLFQGAPPSPSKAKQYTEKQINRQLSTVFASCLLKLHIRANWSCFLVKCYFGSTPVTGLFICSKGNLKPSVPHVLGCFSSFAWILHVVGEKVRALPRPEGTMDKYTSDKVTETRILENSR